MSILNDEMRLAQRLEKPILPFLLSATEMPFGFGSLVRTEAFSWDGSETHGGVQELVSRLASVLGPLGPLAPLVRPRELNLGSASLPLPNFAFSLSSFETRIRPEDGIKLFNNLRPGAVLVSAYDVHQLTSVASRRGFVRDIREFAGSGPVVILDSGNYEASHRSDRFSKRNQSGWRPELFHEVALDVLPDVAFHFDRVDPVGTAAQVGAQIIREFVRDWRTLGDTGIVLCPIIHLPKASSTPPGTLASEIAYEVAKEVRPTIIAVPERELGDGLQQRALAIKEMRIALNRTGEYVPLHVLGTGNPWSMAAFGAAGADLFDGLEWCRTVADYQNGALHHFHHLDLVIDESVGRMQDPNAKALLLHSGMPYAIRTLAHNVDFFEDWMRTMRNLLHAGQDEFALRAVPRSQQLSRALFPERGSRERG